MKDRVFIEPRRGFSGPEWKELYMYRDMFRFLTLRSIKARYAQSMIGVGWAVIQPVFSMLVFTVVFGTLAKVGSNGVPYALFSFAGLVPWTYFANALTDSTTSLIANSSMISKVRFPRLVLPLSAVAAKLVDFVIGLGLLVVLMAFYGVLPGRGIVVVPLLVLMMVITAAGAGMWLSSLAIQYRDVSYAMGFFVQLLMYGAPVVYPASLVPESYRLIYSFNPMAGVIEGFRSAFLATGPMPWVMIGIGSISAVFLFVSGAMYFSWRERVFADVA